MKLLRTNPWKFSQGDNEGEWKGYERTARLNLTGIRAEANTCELYGSFRNMGQHPEETL